MTLLTSAVVSLISFSYRDDVILISDKCYLRQSKKYQLQFRLIWRYYTAFPDTEPLAAILKRHFKKRNSMKIDLNNTATKGLE
ncbi:hypothetical protein [Thermoflavifilum thermophilum]|uniref:Uncharacterized protein n=1 Tax=Thermoflavifilum thermophilum TaxID=1393122 RepID=A0A1I7NFC5_9BACT|nr:hypothetical protein [Thermoflavifilum thermophilum]SFV33377.1 hypothetical protein SAMN05660895_1668 [Thermoflavifilum thermophilum]